MIKEVILENFKSYYGEHRIICGQHFNSIIGPNGSGKSNFIDAIQFIFGKRATSMRCRQVSQLISQGRDFCRVEVKFADFTLKRIAQGSNTEVFINDEVVKQTKLHAFLKSKNIDATNKFIILQGEVESISMMKPKSGSFEQPGLLEYIEDEYQKEQMEESFKQKQVAQSSYFESQEKANIVQSALNEVKGMVNVEDFVLRTYSRIFRIQIYSIEIAQKENIISSIDDQIMQNQTDHHLHQECHDALVEELKDSRQDKDKLDLQIKETQNTIKVIQIQINSLNNKYDNDEELKCQLDINKAIANIDLLRIDKDGCDNDQRRLEQIIPERQRKVDQVESQKGMAETHYNKLKSDIKVESRFLLKQKEELEQKLQPFKKQLSELDQEMERLLVEKERTSRGSGQYLKQIDEFNKKNETLQKQFKDLCQHIDKQITLQGVIKKRKEETQFRLNELKMEEKRLVSEISSMQSRLDQNNEERQEKTHYSNIMRAIHRAAQAGQVRICGRLGDLGTIDPKFECAITTACPGLDGIVVETDHDAIQCIEYLKTNQIGRALFIPINKVPENVLQFMQRPFRQVDRAQRLFDLIQFKEDRYRSVFYNLLRDTLVVENIEIAREVGIGLRKRVVTIDGKLVEQSGVMSGGPEQRKGGMSSKFVEELSHKQREELMNERNQLKVILDQNKAEIQEKEQVLKTAIQDEETVTTKHKQRIVDKSMLLEQIQDNKKQIEILEIQYQECHYNQQRNQEVIQEIERITIEKEKIVKKTLMDESDLSVIEAKIKEIANSDLNSAKETFTNFQLNLEQCQQELIKAVAQKNVIGKKIVQLNSDIQTEEGKLKELQENLRLLQTKKHADFRDIEELKQKLQVKTTEIDVYKAKQVIAASKVEDLLKKISSLKTVLDETKAKNDQLKLKRNVEKNELETQVTRQKELIEQHREYFLSFDSGNINLFFNSSKDSQFHQEVIEKIQKVRGIYYQKFREYFIASAEELLPPEIPQEVIPITNGSIYIEMLQKLSDIHTEMHPFDNAKQDKLLIKTYIIRALDYQNKLKKTNEDEKNYLKYKSKNEDLFQERKIQFAKTLRNVDLKLKEIYKQLSMGGEAEIKVIDELEIFKEGLQFMVKPPNKTWKQISKLSGGEKTLASLSLMLAIHFYKPTPIYILDEIDAALDFKNVKIVAEYLDSIQSQFIIVSLRTNMFEKASNLIGVYMREGGLQSTEVIQLEI